MKRVFLALLCVLILPRLALAVDLATAFGASAGFTALPGGNCQLVAVHSGSNFTGSVGITANGSDSAVISLNCLNLSITSTVPVITVNGRAVNNVAFPQTVTSTGAGVWVVQVGNVPSLTIVAQ